MAVEVAYKDDGRSVCATHPSYGIVSFSRVSTASKRLFGSDINHRSFIRLRIGRAGSSQDKELHLDRVYSEGLPIVEVDLSSSQFAELLTTMNIGEGVPCTISFEEGKMSVQYVEPFQNAIQDKANRLVDNENVRFAKKLDEIKKLVEEIGEKKSLTKQDKQTMSRLMDSFIDMTRNGFRYSEEKFREEAERSIADIKSEIDATLVALKEKHFLAHHAGARDELTD